MKNWLKYTLLLLFFAGGIIAMFIYKEFNRKSADMSHTKADFEMQDSSLLKAFMENEEIANKNYLGKILKVSGTIAEIKNEQDTALILFLGNPEHINKIDCLMNGQKIHEARQYKIGDRVSIKGQCAGYLMDVSLNNCAIVK